MGILVGVEQVSHEWPGKVVFKDATIGIYEGDRIGIVGRNGDGKSTLLELIAGGVVPDSGSVTLRNGVRIGILGQQDALSDNDSVGRAIVGDLPEYEWAADARIRKIISELVGDLSWDAPVGTLSGGQRRRADLARLLIADWDVLLLDEPTNHLDMRAIKWLAEHLKSRWHAGEGALLVVTHDRWFLDEVCESMWEVHDGAIEPFEGGYSAYIQQRVERDRQARVAEIKRQNTLRKELNWLAHGAQARTSKPRFRVEAARALIADDPPLRNPLELKRLAVGRLGKQVIDMHGAGFSFEDGTPVFSGIEWLIGPGERIGILGANGAGKTTLLRVMTGRLEPTEGRVKVGKSVRAGWLSQHLDLLDERADWRVDEVLAKYRSYVVIDGKETSSEALLERLGFTRKEFATRIFELSGGQRRRLSILLVLLEEPNVLVLDEPGNDLDTDMLAEVESLLDSWPGTLLLVSHDRYLMERVTDDQYALLDGELRHMPGGIDEYLRLEDELHERAGGGDEPPAEQPKAAAPAGLTNAERRDAKRRFDAVARKLEKLAGEPERLEDELAAVDPADYQALIDKQQELEAMRAQISDLEEEWLELDELLS